MTDICESGTGVEANPGRDTPTNRLGHDVTLTHAAPSDTRVGLVLHNRHLSIQPLHMSDTYGPE